MNNSLIYQIGAQHEEKGDMEAAYRCYLEAALSRDAAACLALARMYFEGDHLETDLNKAGRYYALAYDNGADVESAGLILAGDFAESSEKTDIAGSLNSAAKYYKAAAEKGESFGYDCLGSIYIRLGDYEKAKTCLEKSGLRNPCGLYNYACLYDQGLGVSRDMEKAVEYYKKAAKFNEVLREKYGTEDDYASKAEKRLSKMRPGDGVGVS